MNGLHHDADFTVILRQIQTAVKMSLRKYFHLTDEGDARIRRFLDEWKEVVRICRMIEEEQTDEGGRRHE